MANGQLNLGKQSGGVLSVSFPDGVSNTEVVLPESGELVNKDYVDTKLATATNVSGGRVKAQGTGNDYNLGGVEVLGNGPANTVFPTIGFHQAELYASSLQLRDGGDFRFYAQGAGSYANITANTFIGKLSGNADSATNAENGVVASSHSANGYVKLGSGLIIQWGTDRPYDFVEAPTALTINFPIAFPNACFLVNGHTQTSYNNPGNMIYTAISSWTQTSFVRPRYIGRMAWIAIGY